MNIRPLQNNQSNPAFSGIYVNNPINKTITKVVNGTQVPMSEDAVFKEVERAAKKAILTVNTDFETKIKIMDVKTFFARPQERIVKGQVKDLNIYLTDQNFEDFMDMDRSETIPFIEKVTNGQFTINRAIIDFKQLGKKK